tara:strand:+ start:572 stop:2356 length:1785 start_codon:yes stop_codon:yes gene_type:complete
MAKTTFQMLVDVKTRGENGIRKLGNAMQGVQGKAKNLAISFKGIAGPLAAIAGLSAGAALAGIFGTTAELQSQTRSLEVLTGSAEKTKQILAEIKAFGAVTPFQVKDLVDITKKLKAFGIETNSLVDTTKRLADVSGATGAELDGIATAFGQIRAKGKFAQEENLQLLERGVDLTGELKKMYNLSGEELAKAMTKGQIGFEAANIALIKLTNDGGQYFNGAAAQADTLNGKLSTLQDAFVTLGQNIGKVLEPIFKGIIDFVTFLTNSINNLFTEAEIQSQAMKNLGLDKLSRGARFRGPEGTQRRRELKEEVERLRAQGFGKKPTVDLTPPALLPGGVTAGGAVKQQSQASDALLKITKQINLEKVKGNEFALANLEYDKAMLKIQEDGLTGANREIALSDAQTDLNLKKLQLLGGSVEKTKELNKETEKTNGLFESIKSTVATGLANAIEGLIDGTKSLSESLSGVLRQMASLFLQAGTKSLIGSIFPSANGNVFAQNGIVPYAKGGYIGRPTMALMGEAGPEAVLPLRRGANGKLGVESSGTGASNVVVNVDASGSNVQGDQPNAKALGSAIGAAVQAELIKQKRPGGLLAG